MVGNGNVTFGRAFFFDSAWHNISGMVALLVTKSVVMSEKELNAYRLTSMEEPTDEMLSAIMKEAAEDAAKSTAEALDNYFKEILSMMNRKTAAV